MGRAVIVSGGSGGLYTVKRVYNTERRDAILKELNSQINELEGELSELESKEDDILARVRGAQDELDLVIGKYVQEQQKEDGDFLQFQEQIKELKITAVEINRELVIIRRSLSEVRGSLMMATKRKELIEGANPEPEPVWCADCTAGLSPGTEVATIELPGEPQHIVIAPGGRSPTDDDGILMPPEWMSPAQAFFNVAILPGVQRWRQIYRTGIIKELDRRADTCDLKIVNARSSQQSLSVNNDGSYSDVPLEYMGGGAENFCVGDTVVAEVSADGIPLKVIGFKERPRGCGEAHICFPTTVHLENLVPEFDSLTQEGDSCSADDYFDDDDEDLAFSYYEWMEVTIKANTGPYEFPCGYSGFDFELTFETTPKSKTVRQEYGEWERNTYEGNKDTFRLSNTVPVSPYEPDLWQRTINFCEELIERDEPRSTSIILAPNVRSAGNIGCFIFGDGSTQRVAKTTPGTSVDVAQNQISVNDLAIANVIHRDTGITVRYFPLYFHGFWEGAQGSPLHVIYIREDLIK